MNLMDLFVKIGVDDQASGKVASITNSISSGIATAAKIGTAALGAVSTAVAALSKSSISQYADYEQLVGGVETLFKKNASTVLRYAQDAYKTSGLSANQYMETVTSFSASLLQGLNGDTAKAAKIADMAITDMADNANKMGTSMEMIQNAYQGFAKDNYTLLDNLKLGYGGTQSEMARLINDSGVLGKSVEVTAESVKDVPFNKIIEAIHVIQSEMGITGTTAKEASETISGSWASTKAAWKNLLTGMADPTQDFDKLLSNFLDSASKFGDNLIPRVKKSLQGIGKLIVGLSPVINEAIPVVVQDVLPSIINSGVELLFALIRATGENADALIDGAVTILEHLARALVDNSDTVGSSAASVVGRLVNALVQIAPTLINAGLVFATNLLGGMIQGLANVHPLVAALVAAFMAYKATLAAVQVVQTIVTAAQALMNGVMIANPIGAVVTAVATLITFLGVLIGVNKKASSSMQDSWSWMSGAGDDMNAYANSIDNVNASIAQTPSTDNRTVRQQLDDLDAQLAQIKSGESGTSSTYTSPDYSSIYGSYGSSYGTAAVATTPVVGEQTFKIYLGEEKLTDIIVDIVRKEVRTT